MRKKIGILTFHRADNYGAVLQNYALQQIIRQLGLEGETIDYCYGYIDKVYDMHYLRKRRNLKQFINYTLSYLLNFNAKRKRKNKFKTFRKEKLSISRPYSETEILDGNIDLKYDVIITGSDQVWNPQLVKGTAFNIYALDFKTNARKISYAASAGGENAFTNHLLSKVKKLDEITVREKTLSDWLEKNGIPAHCVCDPVLLLPKEFWEKEFCEKKDRKKYVFLYYVGSEDKTRRKNTCKLTKQIAKERGLAVHYAVSINKDTFMLGHNVFSDGPKEFINEIRNADFIVASSFHAVAFSIIFEKQFVTVLHEKTGNRVKDFLEMLNLSDRIISDFNTSTNDLTLIDYKSVNKRIDEYRNESINLLKTMINR